MVGVVVAERSLMRPFVAGIHEQADIGALGVAEFLAEDLVPAPPHQVQPAVHIKLRQQRVFALKGFLGRLVTL